jgi:hypothetical protein
MASWWKALFSVPALGVVIFAGATPPQTSSGRMENGVLSIEVDRHTALSWAVDELSTLGRVHPAMSWGGALLVITAVSRTMVAGTDAWLAFAKILIG